MKKIPFQQFRYIKGLSIAMVGGLLIGAGNGYIVGGIISFILDIFFYMSNSATRVVMIITGLPFFYFVVKSSEKDDGDMYILSMDQYMKNDAGLAYHNFQTKVLKLNYPDIESLDTTMSVSAPDHHKKFIEIYSEQYFTGNINDDAVFKKYKEFLESNVND